MGAPLFGQAHVDRYRETDGEDGHDWQGTTVLLLTTTGRISGAKRTAPLIYERHGDDYLVVASNGGGDPPGWFLELQADPIVTVQVKADHHTARARVPRPRRSPSCGASCARLGCPTTSPRRRPTARARWWSSGRARPSGRFNSSSRTRRTRDKPHGSTAPGPFRKRILVRDRSAALGRHVVEARAQRTAAIDGNGQR